MDGHEFTLDFLLGKADQMVVMKVTGDDIDLRALNMDADDLFVTLLAALKGVAREQGRELGMFEVPSRGQG